jgi:dolichyl-phosphate beta-glucosyltransferase
VRRVLSFLFRFPVFLAGVRGMHDTQCGFKLFRMSRMRPLFEKLKTRRFAFDVELILGVQRAGGRVVETPVAWQGGRRSSLRVMRDAPRMLWDVMKMRFMR